MQKRTKITSAMLQTMKDMSAQGTRARVIADTLGIAQSTTSNCLSRLGIVRKHHLALPQETIDGIHLRYKRGDAIKSISTALRIGESTVRRHISSLPKREPPKAKTPLVKSAGQQMAFAKSVQVQMPAHIKVQKITTHIPDYAPICASSTRGSYVGSELKYRR